MKQLTCLAAKAGGVGTGAERIFGTRTRRAPSGDGFAQRIPASQEGLELDAIEVSQRGDLAAALNGRVIRAAVPRKTQSARLKLR
jgi:hypothetical protein